MAIAEHVRNTGDAIIHPKREAKRYAALTHDAYGKVGDALFYRGNIRDSKELRGFSDDEIKVSVNHIAVILDRNRTFARIRKIDPKLAHEKGAQRVEELLTAFSQLPIETVSLWGFSVSNWKRTPEERNTIFKTMVKTLDNLKGRLMEEGIQFRHIGWQDEHEAMVGDENGNPERKTVKLPKVLIEKIKEVEGMTKDNKKPDGTTQTLVLLADYDQAYENAMRDRKVSDTPLALGEERELRDDSVIIQTPDGFTFKQADLILRTGEDEKNGIHMSGFGRIGAGVNTTWRGAKEELPALRKKTIVRVIRAKLDEALNGGK